VNKVVDSSALVDMFITSVLMLFKLHASRSWLSLRFSCVRHEVLWCKEMPVRAVYAFMQRG